LPDNFDKVQDTINDKTALQKKWSVGSHTPDIIPPSTRQRPAQLCLSKPFQNKLTDSTQSNNKNIFKANPVEVVTENKVNNGQIEDNVNVKERASIFGQRKISESKVRMVSAQPEKIVGDMVTVTGNKIGQHFDGGYSGILTVKAGWCVHTPPAFTSAQTMAIGSAGHTAMMCITHLEEHGDQSSVSHDELKAEMERLRELVRRMVEEEKETIY